MIIGDEMSSETIDVKFEHIKTFSFLHGELPIHLVDEVNNYVDEKGEINLNDDTPKGLCNLLKASGQSFVGLYSEQLPLSMDGNSFENVPVECENMRIIEKTERTYTHLLDYDTDYTTKSISFTSLLYLKVPEQINVNNKHSGGCTYFNWGTNTQADHFSLKPKQDKFTVPQVGRFILFPSWLKHSMIPFSGDGALRVLLANFKVRFTL